VSLVYTGIKIRGCSMKRNIEEAIEKLYQAKRDDLITMYRSRAGANDVEDLVQEGFYRALVYKDSYREELVDLEFWFVGIINNCLRDLLREKQNGSAMHSTIDEDTAIYELEDKELQKEVLKEIELLPANPKNICYLALIMGYTVTEVSKILRCSKQNAQQCVARFCLKFKDRYPELGQGYDSI